MSYLIGSSENTTYARNKQAGMSEATPHYSQGHEKLSAKSPIFTGETQLVAALLRSCGRCSFIVSAHFKMSVAIGIKSYSAVTGTVVVQ